MKYTKKFMVVPFEEETETEILNRKEKEQDKKLSDILRNDDPKNYNEYNELFKKSIYKQSKKLPIQNNNHEKFEKELNTINDIIKDILENKQINDDNFYKPIHTQTRSKKLNKSIKPSLKKKTNKRKSVKRLNTSQLPQSVEDTLNTGISESFDPDTFKQIGNIIKEQIKKENYDKILTDDSDTDDNKTPNKTKQRKKKQNQQRLKKQIKLENHWLKTKKICIKILTAGNIYNEKNKLFKRIYKLEKSRFILRGK